MLVYVLFRTELKTGYETFMGVYSTKEKANEYIKERGESGNFIEYSIIETKVR